MSEKPSIDQIHWYSDISDALKQQLVDIARIQHGLTGIIQPAGYSRLTGLVYFVSGIQTFCYTPKHGGNVLGAIFGAGDWLGSLALWDDYKVFILAEEVEPASVLYFPGKEIERLTEKDPNVYKWLFFIAKRTQRTWTRANLAAQHDKNTRAAFVILEMAIRQAGAELKPMTLAVSQQQLADVTGISRSRLNEVLKGFEQDGDISLRRGSIELKSPQALSARLHSLNSMFQSGRDSQFSPD